MEKDYFPQNLKFLLDSGKITVKTILNITGNNSPGLITMWKNNERQITTKDLVTIANHLNLTVDDLINKDLRTQKTSFDNLDVLYSKSKNLLNETELDMIRHSMQRAIERYEAEKSKGN